MNKINIKVWVSTKSGMPLNNNPVLCRLKLDEQNITKDAVLFVNDDGEWRTDDDCEISYSWNVVSWQSEVEVETNIENIGDVENFLAHKEKEIELKNTEIEILQHKITKLKFAGSGLANCCYNLSQQAGTVLSRRDAESMKKSYERWDLISKK